ncbi:hypothetical protein HDU98_012148 [Podochytrium sp. JEL0797]|nr:hypothetical protein HDU98_012148 [Podochytrium sp. JEL0797]
MNSDVSKTPVNLLFTGHSLGGALATIASVDVFQHLSDQINATQIHLLTFAQPRVGNPTFSTWIHSLHFATTQRVTNQNDWTPHLPPRFSGFRHYHEELWIASKDGETVECWDDNGEVEGGDGRKRKGWWPGEEEEEEPPVVNCMDRWKWKYDVMKHGEVWGEPIGFHVCLWDPRVV